MLFLTGLVPDRAAGKHDEAHEFSKHSRSGSHRQKKTAWAELFQAMPPPLFPLWSVKPP